MAAGAFVIDGTDEDFNLKPKEVPDPIPDDQRRISHDVYEARNILKLLKEQGAFRKDNPSFKEFITRVLQAAETGCTAKHVNTTLAAEALEQIRKDVVRRKGRAITYRYLSVLVKWALAGMAVGAVIILVAKFVVPELMGYGWVIMGSMAGAWISLAATRREISFEAMQDFVDLSYEPFIRMLFVGALASIVALFLQLKILTMAIGNVDLFTFPENLTVALLLGLIAGIGEKAVSVQVFERTRKLLGP